MTERPAAQLSSIGGASSLQSTVCKNLCLAFVSQIDPCHERVIRGELEDRRCPKCQLAIECCSRSAIVNEVVEKILQETPLFGSLNEKELEALAGRVSN